MEELRELVGILAKHRLKKIEIINNSSSKQSKAGKQSKYTTAFHALLDGKFGIDEEAARFLGFKKAGNAYYTFKHRFQEKLLNGLFYIDVTFSKYVEAEYQCSRLRHCVNMLLLYGCRNTAIEFTEKLLSIAQKYNLAEYKMFCHKTLREHFAYTGNDFRYQKHNILYEESLAQMLLENKAEDF